MSKTSEKKEDTLPPGGILYAEGVEIVRINKSPEGFYQVEVRDAKGLKVPKLTRMTSSQMRNPQALDIAKQIISNQPYKSKKVDTGKRVFKVTRLKSKEEGMGGKRRKSRKKRKRTRRRRRKTTKKKRQSKKRK
jgi:hypothetical protein